MHPPGQVGVRSVLRRALPLALAVAAAGGCRAGGAPDEPGGGRLELEEVFSVTLPDTFTLSGAALSSGGTPVAWAADRPYLLYDPAGAALRLGAGVLERPLAAAFVAGDTLLEVVDRGRGRIVRLAVDGGVRAEQALALPVTPESATRVDGAWHLAGRDGAGDYRVFRWAAGAATEVHRIDRAATEDTAYSAHLAAHGSEALLTHLRAPFEVARLAPPGSATTFRPDLRTVQAQSALAGGDGWVSLPALPLDAGFLQTLADLRSDRRMLVLYDGEGRTLRHTLLDVPLGMMASAPEHRLLLAARRTDRAELVGYRWHWSTTPDPREEP